MIEEGAEKLFGFEEGTINLNHGGFGAAPVCVCDAQKRYLDLKASNPTKFYACDFPNRWRELVAIAAKRFNVDPEGLTFVQNASDGIVAVLRSLKLEAGDEILTTNLTYGAVDIAAKEILDKAGGHLKHIDLPFPVSEAHDVAFYASAVAQAITQRTKLVILDHVSSATALVFPIKEMVDECRKQCVPVLVDAAHVPGHIKFDIKDIDPDWYVANLHKWYFVPQTCAIMWAAENQRNNTKPNVLSWNLADPYSFRFEWTGTRDPSPIMSIPDAFAFIDRFGEDKIISHNHSLMMQALDVLCEEWGADITIPERMCGSMATVPMPKGLPFSLDDVGRKALQVALIKAGITISVPLAEHGRHYARITAQIYNSPEDYKKLARVVKGMVI